MGEPLRRTLLSVLPAHTAQGQTLFASSSTRGYALTCCSRRSGPGALSVSTSCRSAASSTSARLPIRSGRVRFRGAARQQTRLCAATRSSDSARAALVTRTAAPQRQGDACYTCAQSLKLEALLAQTRSSRRRRRTSLRFSVARCLRHRARDVTQPSAGMKRTAASAPVLVLSTLLRRSAAQPLRRSRRRAWARKWCATA